MVNSNIYFKLNTALRLLAVGLFLLVVTSQQLTYAQSTNIYKTLQTPFYDPGDSTAIATCAQDSGGSSLQGNNNVQKIWNYLIDKGLIPVQAAGIMGNLRGESGLNPKRVQSTPTPQGDSDVMIIDGRTGYGLAQWTSSGRQQGLHGLAASRHVADSDLATQLDWLWSELTGGYKNSTYTPLTAATDTRTATHIFLHNFEAPQVENLDTRTSFADEILTIFGSSGGGSVPAPVGDPGQSASSDPCTTPATTGSCSYQDPLRDVKGLRYAGYDQGVDFSGEGPVYAVGCGTVIVADANTGWPGAGGSGGTYIGYKLNSGTASGKVIYVAENCTPLNVHTGQSVTSSTVLCNLHNVWPYIETGWSQDNTTHYPLATCTQSSPTALGYNFGLFLISVGAKNIPSVASGGACPMPSGWPTKW